MARDHAAVEGCAAALAGVPLMGPRRGAALVRAWGFVGAWARVRAGDPHRDPAVAATMGADPAELARTWARSAADVDPPARRAAHAAAGVDIVTFGSDRFPSALAADIDPPMVLFARGDLSCLSGPRVAVVGTRRATGGGRQTAADFGAALAGAGVRVVSGLALGIDGAAHQGALRRATSPDGGAPVVGVVGTGLDVVYPRQHLRLWRAVADHGVLLSEAPLGTRATRWRFPARNRLIAALSHVVVVVESHAHGGALHTVDEAVRRDRHVMSVPGSVRSPASAGTNGLLHDGAAPACSPADVLRALELSSCDRLPSAWPDAAADAAEDAAENADDDATPSLSPEDAALLDDIGGEPVGLDQLADRCGLDLGELSVRLARLEDAGRIARVGGAIERSAAR